MFQVKSQREKIIQNYFDPHVSFDFNDLYEWLAPDVILIEAEGLPWSGFYYGLKGIGDYMSKITMHIISQVSMEEIFSCNDKVIIVGKSVGRIVKTKQPFSIRVVVIFTFDRENKIKKVEFLPDLNELQEMLEEKRTAT